MSTRRQKGLAAIRGAMAEAAPAVHLVPIDGIPRAALSPAEVAAVLGVHRRTVYDGINCGQIPVVQMFDGNDGARVRHHIPTSWLAQMQAEARPLDPTA